MRVTRRISQPLADEYLGADGNLWHLLACGQVVPAWCYTSGDAPSRRTCPPCAEGTPVEPGLSHHAACCCRSCDGKAAQQAPRSHLDSARQYGLLEGGPVVNVERCAALLAEGEARGVVPKREPADVIAALMGSPRPSP